MKTTLIVAVPALAVSASGQSKKPIPGCLTGESSKQCAARVELTTDCLKAVDHVPVGMITEGMESHEALAQTSPLVRACLSTNAATSNRPIPAF